MKTVQYLVDRGDSQEALDLFSSLNSESPYQRFSEIALLLANGQNLQAREKNETLLKLLKGTKHKKLIYFSLQQKRSMQ